MSGYFERKGLKRGIVNKFNIAGIERVGPFGKLPVDVFDSIKHRLTRACTKNAFMNQQA